MSTESPTPVWQDPRVERGMRTQFAALEEGRGTPVGWKLGLGAKAAMETAGTAGPLLGYLTAATRLDNGAEIEITDRTNPLIEPEIAIHLGADLDPGASREQAMAAVSALGIAFEVVDIDLPIDQVEELLAAGVFHHSYVLGEPVPDRAGALTAGLDLTVTRNSEQIARTDAPEAAIGALADLIRLTADYLGAFGHRLRAGQFIISGSIVPPIPVAPGEEFTFQGGDLGELTLSFSGSR